MTAIDQVFARTRDEGRAALIPFVMAGDPDLETTPVLLEALVAGGADLLEIGVPFSDPIADGPVNQRAAGRALAAGCSLSGILRLVARHRDRLGVPIVLFSYFNPILSRGLGRFAEQAAASGVDAVLCVDLPPEEAEAEWIPTLTHYGIDPVFLLAPTSDRRRIALVDRVSRGFVYYVSRTGVTGDQGALPVDLVRDLKRVRRRLSRPLTVGFGVSDPRQVAELGGAADGIVVGSALVRMVEQYGRDAGLPGLLESRVRDLVAPLKAQAKVG